MLVFCERTCGPAPSRVDHVRGKVDLSLRLSQVDPEAAKKLRQKLGRRKEGEKKKKKLKKEDEALQSDGESCDDDISG